MKVSVLLFGPLAEVAPGTMPEFEVPAGACVADVVGRLRQDFPALVARLDAVAFAVNAEYARPERPLAEGDAVALIPPVSGG